MAKSKGITSLAEYNKVREDINKTPLPELVNHPYIADQLGIYYGEGKKLRSIINLFKSNYIILMTDTKVIKDTKGCDHFLLLQSLINLTKDNLSLNPADDESCIVKYKNEVKGIPMWRGRLKRMLEKGVIEYIERIEVIYESDEFIDKGNSRFIHKKNLSRPVDDKMMGVALEARMPNGRPRYLIVSAAEIEQSRLKSPYKDGAWKEFPDKMWKKTAVIIFESEIGKKTNYHAADEDTYTPAENSYPEGTLTVTKSDGNSKSNDKFDDHEIVGDDEPPPPAPTENTGQQVRDLPVQNPELRAKLEGMKGLLPDDKKEKLAGVINILTDEKINLWIGFIEKELENSRKVPVDPQIQTIEDPKKENVQKSLKDSPI